jgi:hypothetical protein
MSRLFIDTAYLLALFNQQDEWHDRALAWAGTIQGRLWTTDYILLELADALAARARAQAIAVLNELQQAKKLTLIRQSRRLFDRGLELYRQRRDKEWSLTDCISFVVMTDKRLQDALTSDHHFEQAGFRALLRQPPPASAPP